MKIRFTDHKIKDLLKRFPLVVVDVGARGGLKEAWLPLRKFLRCIAFEPNQEEFRRLSSSHEAANQIQYYNFALWDARRRIQLHLTEQESLASAFLPNQAFLRHFDQTNTKGFQLQSREVTMEADRLDSILSDRDRTSIDYLKVDVEGAAYQVLMGSEGTLRESIVLGMRIEAEFNEKYKGQHLFSSVDSLLRHFEYELFNIKSCCWKRKAGLKTGGTNGQPIHGELTYFLNPDAFFERLRLLSNDEKAAKVTKYIVLLCLHGVYDMAYELLIVAHEQGIFGPDLMNVFRCALSKSQNFLSRLPKLKDRGLFGSVAYHAFMLLFGIWLERCGYWVPKVEF